MYAIRKMKKKKVASPNSFWKIQFLLFYFQENDLKTRLLWGTVELKKLCCFLVVRGHPPYLSIYGSATLIILFFSFFSSTNSILCVKNCAFLDEFLFLESFSIYSSSPSISSFNPKIHNFLVCTLKCSRMQKASSIGSCEGLGHWIWTCYADSRCLKLIYENVFWYQYSWHWVGPIGQICQEYLIKNDFHILTLDIPIKVRGHKRSIQFSLIIMWWLAITTPPI